MFDDFNKHVSIRGVPHPSWLQASCVCVRACARVSEQGPFCSRFACIYSFLHVWSRQNMRTVCGNEGDPSVLSASEQLTHFHLNPITNPINIWQFSTSWSSRGSLHRMLKAEAGAGCSSAFAGLFSISARCCCCCCSLLHIDCTIT